MKQDPWELLQDHSKQRWCTIRWNVKTFTAKTDTLKKKIIKGIFSTNCTPVHTSYTDNWHQRNRNENQRIFWAASVEPRGSHFTPAVTATVSGSGKSLGHCRHVWRQHGHHQKQFRVHRAGGRDGQEHGLPAASSAWRTGVILKSNNRICIKSLNCK